MNRVFRPARSTVRLIFLAVALTALTVVIGALLSKGASPAEIYATVRGVPLKWWMPLAYLAAYAAMNLLFIPTQPLSILATALWGWKTGASIELVSASLGALPPYLLARRTAERSEDQTADGSRWRRFLEKEGMLSLLVVRIVPVVPYTPLNYLAGVARVCLRDYVVATTLGLIPSTFLFAYFVDSIVAGLVTPAEAAWKILGAGTALLVFIVALRVLSKRLRSRPV